MSLSKGHRPWLVVVVHAREVVRSAATRGAVQRAVSSGALDLLQLRATEADTTDEVVAAGRILKQCIADSCPKQQPVPQLIVNHESVTTALDVGASGWHLKEHLLVRGPQFGGCDRVQKAKELGLMVGCSVHSVDNALLAAEWGVDYIQVGTMFPTQSHRDKLDLEGPRLLSEIRLSTSEKLPPLIGVGGIQSRHHVMRVVTAGANGIAVIRGILADSDPHQAARLYRAWLELEQDRNKQAGRSMQL